MTRYFHLYADGKRIREISEEEYIELGRKWKRRSKTIRLVAISKTDLFLEAGRNFIYVPLKQLLEVLKSCGVIKDEG